MATLPPVVFQVNLAVPAELRWAMRAKGVIEDWLLSDAAAYVSGIDVPVDGGILATGNTPQPLPENER